jgi:hypothetical protein
MSNGRHSSTTPPPDETPEQTIARLEREARDRNQQSEQARGLPVPVTIIVVLTLTALLAWNVIVVGPDGLPTSYVLGGLLGAYAGVDQLLKRRDPPGGSSDQQDKNRGA